MGANPSSDPNTRRRKADLVWLATASVLPILGIATLALLQIHQAGPPQDEGAFLLYADRVLHGAVAHRDFQTFYGPGMPWLLAGVYAITGPNIVAERLVALVIELALALVVVTLGLRWGTRQAAAAGVISAASIVILRPFPAPWLAATTLLLASIVLTTTVDGRTARPWRFVAAGVLAAFALSFRIDLAPFMAFSAFPLLMGRGRMLMWYVAGALVGLIPLATHILVASLGAVFQNVFIDAVLRQSGGRHLPLPPRDLVTLVGFSFTVAAAALAVVASVMAQRRAGGAPRTRLLQAATVLSVGLLTETFQRADLTHVASAACVCLAMLPISLSVLFDTWLPRFRRNLDLALALSSVGVTIAIIAVAEARYGIFVPPAGLTISNEGREFFVLHGEYRSTEAVITDVERISRPGERLFVGPMDMRRTNYTAEYLYSLFPRLVPATYYLEMEPLTANRSDSRLASDVASADVLILTTEWDNWNEPNASTEYGSDRSNQVVADLFCIRAHDGVYRVYTRCH